MYSIETSVCGRVAEDLREQAVLAVDLGLLVGRIVEHLAVHVAEDVVADPAHHFAGCGGEHRGQHALQQRLARLAVVAHVAGVALAGPVRRWPAEREPSDGVKLT